METGDKQKLKDKVAIVTGGGKGIGKAIALAYAKEGASLVLCGRNLSNLEEVCREARTIGADAVPVKADVSIEREVEDMVGETLKAFKKVDILVNNAGLHGGFKTITDISRELWDEVLSVNITGMFLCSKAVIKHMIERRTGNIINLSSGAGIKGAGVRSLLYTVSKFGAEGFNWGLAYTMKPYGICVNAMRPGPTDTDMHKNIPPEFRLPKLRKPNGIGDLAVFLAMQTVDTMTGESILLEEWERSLQEP